MPPVSGRVGVARCHHELGLGRSLDVGRGVAMGEFGCWKGCGYGRSLDVGRGVVRVDRGCL